MGTPVENRFIKGGDLSFDAGILRTDWAVRRGRRVYGGASVLAV